MTPPDGSDRFIVDIYDKGSVPKGRACYYNFVRDNMAEIINGSLYLQAIENRNIDMIRNVGRLSVHNIADRLNVYRTKDGPA